jgi:hypothetical protein
MTILEGIPTRYQRDPNYTELKNAGNGVTIFDAPRS